MIRYCIDFSTDQELKQTAALVFLMSYVFNYSWFLLISGIGQPYDPTTGHGVVVKKYAARSGT
jgi:gluconate 2-dehydrogenase alpha chain